MIKNQREWVASLRELSLMPGSPVRHKNGHWEVIDRKGTWAAIGPRLFDAHLEQLKNVTVEVLSERDPKFQLEKDQRFAAIMYGKALSRSHSLRKGLAETLALLGSSPEPLTSCSNGK